MSNDIMENVELVSEWASEILREDVQYQDIVTYGSKHILFIAKGTVGAIHEAHFFKDATLDALEAIAHTVAKKIAGKDVPTLKEVRRERAYKMLMSSLETFLNGEITAQQATEFAHAIANSKLRPNVEMALRQD